MLDSDFTKMNNFLQNTNFNSIDDYSKNKRHLSGIVKNLSRANKEQIELLLPTLNIALTNMRATQEQIQQQKLDSSKNWIQKAGITIKHVWYGSHRISSLFQNLNTVLRDKEIDYTVSAAKTTRFKEVVGKLQTVAKGATKPGAKHLAEDYWQETIGLRFEIDGKPYTGQIYMGYFSTTPQKTSYLSEWKDGVDGKGIPYQSKYSFEEFMNNVKIPSMDAKEKQALTDACDNVVEYYTPEELETLKDSLLMARCVCHLLF